MNRLTEAAEHPCFHCGEPIPAGIDFSVTINGQDRAVCCAGCQAVAQLIAGAGLGRYYQFRQEVAESSRIEFAPFGREVVLAILVEFRARDVESEQDLIASAETGLAPQA